MMERKDLALKAAAVLLDKKAIDVRLLDVAEKTVLADYFLIATVRSQPHMRAVLPAIEDALEELGEIPAHTPGPKTAGWRILDYHFMVVHLFLEEEREYYHLERLWEDEGNRVELPQVDQTVDKA